MEAEKLPDGTPVTLLDIIIDKRYQEREHDSDYYTSDYYYSEEESSRIQTNSLLQFLDPALHCFLLN